MSQKTAFLTGGTGFVGQALTEVLLERGWRVTALHRPSSKTTYLERLGEGVTLVQGDIVEPETVLAGMPEGVDAVFHVAGSTTVWSKLNDLQTRINVEGTRNVVEAALERGAGRFIHTSSISVYGLQKGTITEEADKAGARSWINYQRTKYLAEEEIFAGIERGLDAVILNPASIIGPYDTNNWARFIKLVVAGKLPGVPPGSVSFCHVREVALAHAEAFERGRTGENYLLGGTNASFMELVRTIGSVTDQKVPKRPTPAPILLAIGRMGGWAAALTGKQPTLTPEAAGMITRDLRCDCSKAEKELGFKRVGLRQMVEDSHAWLAAEGLLE